MSIKATVIAHRATTSASRSAKEARKKRAEASAERAQKAARAAVIAARTAYAAAVAGDDAKAAQAAGEAEAGQRAATSAELLVRTLGERQQQTRRDDSPAAIAAAIDRSAHYVVTYNGQLIASFLREDDALLFEAELADLDTAHGVESARCEVRSRRGERLAGYVITVGKQLCFLRDRMRERRLGYPRS